MSGRRLPLFALVAANTASQLGNVVAVVALPWFVLVTTDSPARAGIVAFAATLPLAVGAIVGAPVVDRIGVRRASVLADLGAGAAIAGIPLLHTLGSLAFWHVVALAFAAAVFEAPGRAARRAMLPDAAERAEVALERANSISTTSEHTGYVVGAPLAGVLIASVGAPGALWIDAASFVVSALIVAGAVPSLRSAIGPTRLLDGLRYVVETPVLRTFFVIWTVGGFLIGPLASVLLPVYARQELGGAGSLAACIAAYGLGGLVGSLAYGLMSARLPRRPFFVAMWILYPALSLVLVGLPQLVVVLPLLLAVGLVTGAYDPFEVTIHQRLVPPDLRARAFAILLAAEMVVVPPSMLLYGFLIEEAGLRAALLLFGLGNVALGAYAILNRPARDLDGESLQEPSQLLAVR
jgi:MFS family permease